MHRRRPRARAARPGLSRRVSRSSRARTASSPARWSQASASGLACRSARAASLGRPEPASRSLSRGVRTASASRTRLQRRAAQAEPAQTPPPRPRRLVGGERGGEQLQRRTPPGRARAPTPAWPAPRRGAPGRRASRPIAGSQQTERAPARASRVSAGGGPASARMRSSSAASRAGDSAGYGASRQRQRLAARAPRVEREAQAGGVARGAEDPRGVLDERQRMQDAQPPARDVGAAAERIEEPNVARASSTAMAFTVKSRRRRSWPIEAGSTRGSAPGLLVALRARGGDVDRAGRSASVTDAVRKRSCSTSVPARAAASAAGDGEAASPSTTTSRSRAPAGRPSSASRTSPPTTKARAPCAAASRPAVPRSARLSGVQPALETRPHRERRPPAAPAARRRAGARPSHDDDGRRPAREMPAHRDLGLAARDDGQRPRQPGDRQRADAERDRRARDRRAAPSRARRRPGPLRARRRASRRPSVAVSVGGAATSGAVDQVGGGRRRLGIGVAAAGHQSPSRVERAIHALERRRRQVRVDLRGRDVGVAEHRLHRAQVGPALEQVAGERVAQHVRRHAPLEPGGGRRAAHDRPQRLARERTRRGGSRRVGPRRGAGCRAAARRCRYRRTHASASAPTGTSRCLPPLPVQTT